MAVEAGLKKTYLQVKQQGQLQGTEIGNPQIVLSVSGESPSETGIGLPSSRTALRYHTCGPSLQQPLHADIFTKHCRWPFPEV